MHVHDWSVWKEPFVVTEEKMSFHGDNQTIHTSVQAKVCRKCGMVEQRNVGPANEPPR